ncbi:MAG: M56 family metallopeptidase [Bacteroidia bacterium]|nr:M56 family metallopeptidase [Bacteroidia bacterium]
MNNHFLVYLLEASICQLFFYFVYILFLKKETYFNLNRTYLLCSVLLSLLIPSIQIKHEAIQPYISVPLQTIVEPIQTVTNMVEDKIESRIDVLFILWIIYIVIAAFVLAKFIYQFFRLMLFIRKGEISVLNRHYLICTNGQYPTSSFFGYILWDNTVSLSDKEIEQIIKHEMAHINQFHTLDNLLMELLGILFWFNPFVYLYNKKLKEVHEHIADNEVLNNKEFTSHDYEVLINKQILNNIGFQLSNNFNMSNLKNRIAMITKSRSGKIARLKLTIAIPAAALMMLSFSYAKEGGPNPKSSENIHAIIAGNDFQVEKMSKGELLASGELQTDNRKYVLKSFRMTTKLNGLVMVEDATSGVFTQQMRSMIKKVKSGGTIVFKEIQAQVFDDNDKNGAIVTLAGFTITIK